jgi:hypothetical protein
MKFGQLSAGADNALYIKTAREIAAAAGRLGTETVRNYADEGLVDCVRLANGTRLFRADAAQRVLEIYAQRMSRWRGPPRKVKDVI